MSAPIVRKRIAPCAEATSRMQILARLECSGSTIVLSFSTVAKTLNRHSRSLQRQAPIDFGGRVAHHAGHRKPQFFHRPTERDSVVAHSRGVAASVDRLV